PSANTYNSYALHLVRAGRYDEAVRNAQAAVRMDPRFAQAHNSLGTGLAKQGKPSQAIAEYREALRLMPGWPPAARRLAWLPATSPEREVRNATEALRLARHAADRTGNRDADMLDTLAAAAAEAGQFGEALETAERAAAAAEAAGKTALAAEIRQRADLY